jgi:hypothetical protein
MLDGTQSNELPELTPEELAANAAANAADDDDFLAGFTNAGGEEPNTEVSTSSAGASAPAAAAAPAPQGNGANEGDDDLETDPATGAPLVQPGAAAENDDDAPVTITKRQLAELTSVGASVAALQAELRKTVDSTNGRLGSLQQTMKEVREQAAKGIRPSFDQMEALDEAFPELAAVIKRDLGRAFGQGQETQPEAGDNDGKASGAQAPGAAPEYNPLEAPEVRAALRDAQLAIVDAKHDGWRQFPATPEWQSWQQQLPAAAQELLRTTSDAATLSEALTDFKDWRAKQAATASASTQRDKRLAHAIPATTGSAQARATVLSEQDEFEAGFKETARR